MIGFPPKYYAMFIFKLLPDRGILLTFLPGLNLNKERQMGLVKIRNFKVYFKVFLK